jgi:hypothetical protein
MSTPFSLYDDLTSAPDDKDYEATELAKNLIKVVGHEVSSFNHHAVHSYEIIKKSRTIYQGINTRITTIDADTSEPGANFWDDYDAYTKAIDPLEE